MKYFIIISLLLLGCKEQTQPQIPKTIGYPLQITGVNNQTITLQAPPKKIVIAGTALYAQILIDLDAADRIVGLTRSQNLPTSLQKIITVGTPLQPDLEKIISLEPDIVFGISNDQRHKLEQIGIPVFIIGKLPYGIIDSTKELYKAIRNLDKVLYGNTKRSTALITKTKETIAKLRQKNKKPITAAVIYFSRQSSPYAIGKQSLESELLEMAGAKNVFSKTGPISLEELIKKDPQVIFTDPTHITIAKEKQKTLHLQAINHQLIFGIKASDWVSTNLADTFKFILKSIHKNEGNSE